MSSGFAPLWASPPGRTISTRLVELGLSEADLASILGTTEVRVERLLAGDVHITLDDASQLADALGASQAFWFARECAYRESLERIETKEWVDATPFNAMAQAGWVTKTRTWQDKAKELLSFFHVEDLRSWKTQYVPVLASSHLRASPSFSVNDQALAAWLRKAMDLANGQTEQHFDRDELASAVAEIRPLTRVVSPIDFIPRLANILSETGVTLVVLPTIPGSPVSGASRLLDDGGALLVVSCRYLSDDHFWFTIFHEIGHLLLHCDGNFYLDDLTDMAAHDNPDETEANLFAQRALLPDGLIDRVQSNRLGLRELYALAREAGVSPGIALGQLQHEGKIGHDHALNRVKRRYAWRGNQLTLKSV